MCFEEGDCCSDVTDIGCLPLNGSCIASGHKTCCLNEDALNCTGVPATCYCDQGCFDRDDCCSDIDKLSNCQHSITGTHVDIICRDLYQHDVLFTMFHREYSYVYLYHYNIIGIHS